MRILKFVLTIVMIAGVLLPLNGNASAANGSTDFDTLAENTPAEDLNIGGVTFSTPLADSYLVFNPASFVLSSGFQLTGAGDLTLTFDSDTRFVSFTYASSDAEAITIELYNDGTLIDILTVRGSLQPGGTFEEGSLSITQTVDEITFTGFASGFALDNLFFSDSAPVGYQQNGLLRIYGPIQPTGTAGGSGVELSPGNPLILPNDADGNGYDDYAVVGSETVDGVLYYQLFNGGPDFVWVPASAGEFRINP